MKQDRRDILRKIGVLGATALAFVGVSKPTKADEAAPSNPIVGLWHITFPTIPNLYFKYAISEGGYVCIGNQDQNAAFDGFKCSPTIGAYARTGPNSYRLRERSWAMDANGNPAGYTDFEGSAIVAPDGRSFSGSGTLTQYDLNGKVVFTEKDFPYTAVRVPAAATS